MANTILEWVDEKPEERRDQLKRAIGWLQSIGYRDSDIAELIDKPLPRITASTRERSLLWDLLDRSWAGM